ncbi:MAG: hypothetical protein ABFR97_00455 [Thermodesulfobacteriota bacterium]
MYATSADEQSVRELISNWQEDNLQTRVAFIEAKELLESLDGCQLSFHGRPGITLSLRASYKKKLFAMVDIIDDEPASRWLSICFYGEMIDDGQERGDFVPGGLLGSDACCFDYDSDDGVLLAYILERIREAHDYCHSGR